MSFTTSALLVSWVAIGLLALVVSGLVRQVHALTSGAAGGFRAQLGPRTGAPAPQHAELAGGEAGTLLLLFLSDECRSCAEVLAETARLAPEIATAGVLPRALYRSSSRPQAPFPVRVDATLLFDAYAVPLTPFAVVVGDGGRVLRSEPIGSGAALRELVEQVAQRSLLPGERGARP